MERIGRAPTSGMDQCNVSDECIEGRGNAGGGRRPAVPPVKGNQEVPPAPDVGRREAGDVVCPPPKARPPSTRYDGVPYEVVSTESCGRRLGAHEAREAMVAVDVVGPTTVAHRRREQERAGQTEEVHEPKAPEVPGEIDG